MNNKPVSAEGYDDEQTALIKSTCLYLATKLGDIIDELVVIGGLVPTLLIDPASLPENTEAHVGTMDLDLGLAMALIGTGRYRKLTENLRSAGFTPDINKEGHPTRQRWRFGENERITVDFLIQPDLEEDKGGMLKSIESDFAAIIAPGLHLAFRDRIRINISGLTIINENASRDIWVCGPGAYVVLKALAFFSRGENKDAYDLFYLIHNIDGGIQRVSEHLAVLKNDDDTRKAVNILRNDFLDINGIGPRRVAEFVSGGADENIQADVVGDIRLLFNALDIEA
jgi:hypothetical protein